MLRVVATLAAVFILAFFGAGVLLPAKWKVQRSIVINAPAETIYIYVANLKKWSEWNEFDKADPEAQYRFGGPEQGKGAERGWTSKRMGDGSMRIVSADRASIEFSLDVVDSGFHIDGQIAIVPEGAGTRVTWTDTGEVGRNPLHRAAALMFDKTMGPIFEKSLATLKAKVEAAKQ